MKSSLLVCLRSAVLVGPRFRCMSSAAQSFAQAKERLTRLTEAPGNDVKLRLYALYKQATEGACESSRPAVFDPVGRAKWDAWHALASLDKEGAMKQYAAAVDELAGTDAAAPAGENIVSEVRGKAFYIRLNRPTKKNALTSDMYDQIVEALNAAANDKQTSVTVLCGTGDYFSSGNDLSNFSIGDGNVADMAASAKARLRRYVQAYIDHPKPLVALVNGPAIGVSVTVLGLFDCVLASDSASFHTPFASLGQSPEGCSSYTFPRIMGTAKAGEVLLFGKKLSAAEALVCGLVSEVVPRDQFSAVAAERVERCANLPPESLTLSKRLGRQGELEKLSAVNEAECNLLEQRWQSEECANAVMAFMSRGKAKL